MKKNTQTNYDEAYVRNKIESDSISLPDKLSEKNITELVAGKKQKTPKNAVIRRIISVTAAACIILCSLVIYDSAVYSPKIGAVDGIACAKSYSELSDMLEDYFKSESFGFSPFLYMGKKSSDVAANYVTGDFSAPEMSTGPVRQTVDESSVACSESAANEKNGYSSTNLREAGIEEADIVKTDGEYLYVMNSSALYIVRANGTELTLTGKISSTDGETQYWNGYSDFYILKNRLVINQTRTVDASTGGPVTADTGWNAKCVSGISVYDISDRTSPKSVREIMFDGTAVSSRIVNGNLILVSCYRVDSGIFSADDYKTFLPAVNNGKTEIYPEAEDIVIADTSAPDSFITVSKTDLTDDNSIPQTLTVCGAGSDIYCTADSLYVFCAKYGVSTKMFSQSSASTGVKTEIISFDISGAKPAVRACGCVSGTILNTWSLDEYNGSLRLAALDGAAYIYVLDEELDLIGKSEPMAEGEQIKSVRFSGDTAYVVTFYQTDPLFVADLSEPSKPVIRGELKLPGFSSYLHPAGNGLMIGTGEGGTEDGLDGSTKISLFDVSDPEAPTEVNSLVLEDSWMLNDYRAFTVVGDGTFIIPVTRYFHSESSNSNSYYYDFSEIHGAVRVGIENGRLVLLSEYNGEPNNNVIDLRAMFIGGTVYLVEPQIYDTNEDGSTSFGIAIQAYDMKTAEKIGEAVFTDTVPNRYTTIDMYMD